MSNLLDQLQELLTKEGYQFTFLSASNDFIYEKILISFGQDNQGREKKIEITEYSQSLFPEISPELAAISRLQFAFEFPFKVKDIAGNDMAALLHFLNQSSDMPGFEFNELKGTVLYRYVWITQADQFNQGLVHFILGMVIMNHTLFSEVIETIALGKKTFNDILSEIVAKLGSR